MNKLIAADGTVRYVTGRLRYPDPPEIGTILGPNDIGEWMVVLGHDEGYTLVGYATTGDVEAAALRIAEGGATQSPTEHRLVRKLAGAP